MRPANPYTPGGICQTVQHQRGAGIPRMLGAVTIVLRAEVARDHRAVELVTREAFWGTEVPRCSEHLLVRRLRAAPSHVPELDVVAEDDGALVGHVIWTRATVEGDASTHDVLTFGPLSVLPTYQGAGVGSALMRHTLAAAAGLGHRVVVVYGHPDYYPRFGFRPAAEVGITAPGGATFDALMALALVDGGLDGVHGEFHEDAAFAVDQAEADAFDLAEFPAKEPATLPSLDVLDGHVPTPLVAALRAAGLPNLAMVRRMSVREVAALPGVTESDCHALGAVLRSRGMAWGRTDGVSPAGC